MIVPGVRQENETSDEVISRFLLPKEGSKFERGTSRGRCWLRSGSASSAGCQEPHRSNQASERGLLTQSTSSDVTAQLRPWERKMLAMINDAETSAESSRSEAKTIEASKSE
jgi:hypothetical protein